MAAVFVVVLAVCSKKNPVRVDSTIRNNTADTTWRALGTFRGEVSSLAVSGSTIFAGTTRYGILRSLDNGETWIPVNNGFKWAPEVTSLAVKESSVYVGTADMGLAVTSDNGSSWVDIPNEYGIKHITAFLVYESNILFSTFYDIYLSKDFGVTWKRMASETIGRINALIEFNDLNFIAGTSEGVYISNLDAKNWLPIQNGLGSLSKFIRTMAVHDSVIFLGTPVGVWSSSNSGLNWEEKCGGIGYDKGISCFAFTGTHLYCGATFSSPEDTVHQNTVFVTADRGTSWKPASHGLSNRSVNALAVLSTFLFAGTDSGIWRRSLQ